MRLGIHCSVRDGFVHALDQAVELGCHTLQIFTKSPHLWRTFSLSDDEAHDFRRRRSELKLEPLVVHTPYLPNLSTSHHALYERSIRALNDDLTICARLGADYFIIHPGAYSEGQSVEEGIDRFGQAMTEALAAHPGPVKVLLENMAGGGRRLGSTFAELSMMRAAVTPSDRIGFCLDTAHTLAAGFPLSTAEEVARTLKHFDQVLGLASLSVIHANDSNAMLGAQRDLHQHIGLGHIGLEGFRALVNHPALQEVPFILETPRDTPEDDVKNLTVMRGLLNQ